MDAKYVPESHGFWRKGIWYPMIEILNAPNDPHDQKYADIVHNGIPSPETHPEVVSELKQFYFEPGTPRCESCTCGDIFDKDLPPIRMPHSCRCKLPSEPATVLKPSLWQRLMALFQ